MSYMPSPKELLFHYIAKGEDTMQIAQRFHLKMGTVQNILRITKKDTSLMAKFKKWAKSKPRVYLEKALIVYSEKESKGDTHSRLSFPEQLLAARITPERIKICNENFK